MRKKHRRSLFIMALAYLFLGTSLSAPTSVYAAASGNYTDLLPIGAAADTTVISRGSGYAVTTLPPTSTFGDSLSRLVDTVYQSTSAVTIANTTVVSTFTAVTGQGYVGYNTFPASWVASGRSIRVTIRGNYSTTASAVNFTWAMKIGTTTVLGTGSVTAVGNQTNQPFTSQAIITVGSVGAAGTAIGTWDIIMSSAATAGSANLVAFSTNTTSPVTVDWTTQLAVNPTISWGTQSSGNTITAKTVLVEYLN